MENTPTVDTFKELKKYFNIIIAFLLINTCSIVYIAYRNFVMAKIQTSSYDKISMLVVANDFQKLLVYSNELLKKDPNNIYALFGKAKALYQLGQYKEARELFLILGEKEPGWMGDIKKYLKVIDEKIQEK